MVSSLAPSRSWANWPPVRRRLALIHVAAGMPGIAFELGGDGGLFAGVEINTLQERGGVLAERILLDLMQPGEEGRQAGWAPCGDTTRWRRSWAARGRSRCPCRDCRRSRPAELSKLRICERKTTPLRSTPVDAGERRRAPHRGWFRSSRRRGSGARSSGRTW